MRVGILTTQVANGSNLRAAARVRSNHRCFFQEINLAKPNYRHAKKQKEAARKARQDLKQQRRISVPQTAGAPGTSDASAAAADPALKKPGE
jgi:hypothetical protein